MEEVIQAVTKALSDSPSLALWVLVVIYGFKVVVVGSVYGTIRFVIDRIHSAYLTPKHTLQVIDVEAKLRSMVIGDVDGLVAQLERIAAKEVTGSIVGGGTLYRQYIHGSDVRWLREAIDDKLAKDQAKHPLTV